MHPSDIFLYMAKYFNVKNICYNESDTGTKSYSFCLKKDEIDKIPDELIKAASTISKYSKETIFSKYSVNFTELSYVVSKTGNESLTIIQTSIIKKFELTDGSFKFNTQNKNVNPIFHIYNNGKAWNYTNKKNQTLTYTQASSGFPCSMKDFFYYQNPENSISNVLYALFLYWGKKYFIWTDLAEDFKNGSPYCSIPLDLIFSCSNRKELIEKYCGNSLNRNNSESIGKGLFLAKVKKYILPKDYELLYNYDISPYFLSRDKKTFIKPITIYLEKTLQENFPSMEIEYKNRTIKIDRSFIEVTVQIALELRIPLKLEFSSLIAFYKYHNELLNKQIFKQLPTVKIPQNSIFKQLKMPKNCVRLSTKKQFIEEGIEQNIYVVDYISSVNKDLCSIWSMRNEDGTRYTIKIVVSKGNFKLHQMKGYNNSEPPKSIKNTILKILDDNNRMKNKSTNSNIHHSIIKEWFK